MKKRTVAAAGMCAMMALCSLAFYQGIFAAKASIATLSAVKGKVVFKASGDSEWKSAYDKATAGEGDTIRTGADSSVIIKFNDGSMTKLGPLAILKLDKVGGVGGPSTSLNVNNGKLWSRVRKQGAESTFNVKTPTAVAGVRGTFFSTEAQTDASQVDVFDGIVQVSSVADPNASVDVKAHQRTSVAGDKAPTAPSAIPQADEEKGRSGFSQEEFTSAALEIQVSISPQTLQPGEKATVSVQVFENNAPSARKMTLHLTLSGSAVFAANGTNQIDVTTDAKGAAKLDVSDKVEESVTIDASMTVKVAK